MQTHLQKACICLQSCFSTPEGRQTRNHGPADCTLRSVHIAGNNLTHCTLRSVHIAPYGLYTSQATT